MKSRARSTHRKRITSNRSLHGLKSKPSQSDGNGLREFIMAVKNGTGNEISLRCFALQMNEFVERMANELCG
jgi:hypothetical protein